MPPINKRHQLDTYQITSKTPIVFYRYWRMAFHKERMFWISIIISVAICAIVIMMIEKTIQNIGIVIILGATILWMYIFFILYLISCLAKSIKEKKRDSSVSLSLFIVYVLGFAPASILYISSLDKCEKAYQKKDYKTAIKEYKNAKYLSCCYPLPLLFVQDALKHEDILYHIADIYYFGKGVPRDEKKAAELYRKAVKGGDSWPQTMVKAIDGDKTAQFEAGLLLSPGQGGGVDIADWWRWCTEGDLVEGEDAAIMFRMSAEQGLPEAQRILGCCHHWGEGVEKDDAEAKKWFRLASEQGDKLSEAFLNALDGNSSMLLNSVSIDSSILSDAGSEGPSFLVRDMMNKVFGKWYRELAEQGNPEAQTKLGIGFSTGGFGFKINEAEAVEWYRKAADQGNAKAQFCLGKCYSNGDGVEKDESEAIKWYRKAAEQGDEDAKEALKCLDN